MVEEGKFMVYLRTTKKNNDKEALRGFSVVLKNGEWANFSVLNDQKKSRNVPLMIAKLDANQYLFRLHI